MVSEEASRMSFQIRTRSASLRGSSSFERDRRVFPRRPSLPRPSPGLAADGHELAAQVSPRRAAGDARDKVRCLSWAAASVPSPSAPRCPQASDRSPAGGRESQHVSDQRDRARPSVPGPVPKRAPRAERARPTPSSAPPGSLCPPPSKPGVFSCGSPLCCRLSRGQTETSV